MRRQQQEAEEDWNRNIQRCIIRSWVPEPRVQKTPVGILRVVEYRILVPERHPSQQAPNQRSVNEVQRETQATEPNQNPVAEHPLQARGEQDGRGHELRSDTRPKSPVFGSGGEDELTDSKEVARPGGPFW